MIKPEDLSQLAEKLVRSIPPGVAELPKNLQQHFQQIMREAFAKMDLVTQEEFDVQAKVLQKTRLKLEALEAKVADLEQHKK